MQASLERLRQRREELGDEGGFTLIELLIVIVILAILAAIVVFAVQNLTGTSAQASCKADFKTVESAAEGYKAQLGAYPNSVNNNTTLAGSAFITGLTPSDPPTALADAGGYTSPAAGGENGVGYLLQTGIKDSNSNPLGPWLKDWPVNKGHYEIVVSAPTDNTGKLGQVDVYKSDGSALVATTPTHTATDCNSVS